MEASPFQKKVQITALTALSFVAIGLVITLVGWLVVSAISFMKTLVIPLAISGILAYLLEPVVRFMESWKISRLLSIITVYALIFAFIMGILIWIVPAGYREVEVVTQNYSQYSDRFQNLATGSMDRMHKLAALPIFQKPEDSVARGDAFSAYVSGLIQKGSLWVQEKLPDIAISVGTFLKDRIGGVLGMFGFLLSLILVPIFLFFFLNDGPAISQNWSKYLPLRASPLKDEIVSLLSEINMYLINFFRGQLVVSLIDGAMIAVALMLMNLKFGLLIGILVGVMGLIPYIGMTICWIPAVIIAAAQFGDWTHPLIVTAIFIVANNIDGLLIAPKIVGESVGLHPLTVIISVLGWSLVLGGLMGALLAVPLTATLKVLLKRYFWDKPPEPEAEEESKAAPV